MSNAAEIELDGAVNFVYREMPDPDSIYMIKKEFRAPLRRFGSAEAARAGAVAAAKSVSSETTVTTGYVTWDSLHRVYQVTARMWGTSDQHIEWARAAYELRTGKKAPS